MCFPTPGFLWDLGNQKVKFGSEKAIFGAIWGGFEGFGPCLGISHPNHPHLGKISQKKTFFFGSFPNYYGIICFIFPSWKMLFLILRMHVMGGEHICFVLSLVVFFWAPFRMGLGSLSRTVWREKYLTQTYLLQIFHFSKEYLSIFVQNQPIA